MTRIPLYRLLAYLSAMAVGGVFLSLLTIPTTHPVAIVQALVCATGIWGLWFAWGRESQAVQEIIHQQALEARQEAEAQQWAARDERERRAYAPAPEDAKPLHETARARIGEVRDGLTRLVEAVSAMHHDRCAVYERCGLLEQENEHQRSQLEVAQQIKDLSVLLQGPPLQPGERPWTGPKLVGKSNTEEFIERVTQHIEGVQERAKLASPLCDHPMKGNAMKITVESTTKIVQLSVNGADIPARIWQGETVTADGIIVPVQVFVTRIAPEIPESDPRIDELTREFERDLKRQAKPRQTVEAIPLRMII